MDVWRGRLGHRVPAMRFGGWIAHDAHHVGERHLACGHHFSPHFGGLSVGCALATAASFLSGRHASVFPIYFRSTLEDAAIFGHATCGSFDNLVGAAEQCDWEREVKRLGGLE